MLMTLDKRHEDEYIKFFFREFIEDDANRWIITLTHKRYQ